MKERVGEAFYPFVQNVIGPKLAPKVTGMIIDLPIGQLK
jgi:hypothetical protein